VVHNETQQWVPWNYVFVAGSTLDYEYDSCLSCYDYTLNLMPARERLQRTGKYVQRQLFRPLGSLNRNVRAERARRRKEARAQRRMRVDF